MRRSRRNLSLLAVAIPACILTAIVIALLPPVQSRLAPRLEEAAILWRGIIAPPERVEFRPQGTPAAALPSPTPLPSATATLTATPTQPQATPLPSATPTLSPTPLPAAFNLSGVTYQDQHGLWNYCAPSNLAMALSYWGLELDRTDTGKVLKPNQYDKNVMPYEMADYVRQHTGLSVVERVGGSLELLKRFTAAGFPVLVEKGAYIKDFTGTISWMGHYQVVTGYDDTALEIIAQDSYYTPDYRVPYQKYIQGWRSFNYTYLVIYAPEKEAEVLALLGEDAETGANLLRAAEAASAEIFQTSGVDQFFAWYNRGTSLKELQDYGGAAAAYDEAFTIYNALPEDRSVRPYRMLWYQTGPYYAYYYTGRYYDVISLADAALNAVLDDRPALEESFYWRAMAKAALGDLDGAAKDFRQSLKWHPDFGPTVYQMSLLGLEP
jgi:hypothetical protein